MTVRFVAKLKCVKPVILLLLSLFSIKTILAQRPTGPNGTGKITGVVIDSASGSPLEYATITVLVPGTRTPVTGATSDNTGHFTITEVPAGSHTILVESLGYLPFTINSVSVDKKSVIDLKKIALAKSRQVLQNITIVAQGKLIENKIDKLVFNAEKDLTSQTGVATDVLRKVPQVAVDIDGNVELAGSSSIRFLINGKPSTAFGSSMADVLQAIPAGQIKSIEVITNPGAKYDAQGLGGIINIILKKNTAQGINGNLSLAAGTRAENGSFNFNARKGKLGVNAFISGNLRPRVSGASTSSRTSADTANKQTALLLQNGERRIQRHGFQSGIGFDWTYKEKNSFSGALSYNRFANNGSGITNLEQSILSNSGNVLSDIRTRVNATSNTHEHAVDANLDYKRTFKEDQELDISAAASFGRNGAAAGNTQWLQPKDSLYYGLSSSNPGRENEGEFAADYTQPLKEAVLLGVGGKFSFYDIASATDVVSYQAASGQYVPNQGLSNSLDYHQKVYALYAEVSFPLAGFLDAKVGSRYERTEINLFYSNAQQQASIPGYNTLVPSVYLSKKLGDDQAIKLSYSRRIGRPDYGDLNPFINTSDPKNLSTGNPYLKPEIGNRYELGYNKGLGSLGSVVVSLSYRASNHDIQPYIVYYPVFRVGDSTYTNVSVSSRENIGLEKNTGINLFGDIHFTPKLSVRSNLFFFYRHIINALDAGYNARSFNYRLNMNAGYQFTPTLAAEFFGNFSSARNEVQGRYPSFITYSLAVRKQFWHKNGSLALTATNPFNEYINQRTEVYGPGFTLSSIRKVPFRSFGLGFTWKFGRLEFKKDKEEKDNSLNGMGD